MTFPRPERVVMLTLLAITACFVTPTRASAQVAGVNHFTISGALTVDGDRVADARQVPVAELRFVGTTAVDVVLRRAGVTFEARADLAELEYHVHEWTAGQAGAFEVRVPPNAVRDAAQSTPSAVVLPNELLGEVTLTGRGALPAWVRQEIANSANVYVSCGAVSLFPQADETSEMISVGAGRTMFSRAMRTGWREVWAQVDGLWLRGFAQSVSCTREQIGGGLGRSGSGGGALFRPARVVLPAGLRLVSPSHPSQVVLSVTRPSSVDAWAPGWTSANDDGAIMIEFICPRGWSALTFSTRLSIWIC